MAGKLVKCKHRHCVFTIPRELRRFFLADRSLLNCLFNSVRSVVLRLFHQMNRSKNFTPGFICVLHTFGRPLEWNPHIHCLISEGGFSDDSVWRRVAHFNYSFLRSELEARIGPSFKKTKAEMYRLHDKGFYVYAKPSLADTKTITEYIGRYLGRPVIATKRIDRYDKDADTVTFHYNRHEDNAYVERTLPAMDFIKLLIQHIPEKNFKMIRYYGLYARHRKADKVLRRGRSAQYQRLMVSLNRWRESILLSFGYNPLSCPRCHKEMIIAEIYYNHKRVSLEDLYKKVMGRGKPGSQALDRPSIYSLPVIES